MNLDRIIAVRNTKTVYRDQDKCIKVFSENFSKASILNEALNQARIEETSLNIPRIHEVTVVDGRWSIVSEYIKGKTLAQLMEEAPEKKAEYFDLFVTLHLQVQACSVPLLTKLTDRLSYHIDRSDLSATSRFALLARLQTMPTHRKLCHGDFTPSNVVITEEGVPYILDWAHATQGNASADAATTYLRLKMTMSDADAETYLDLLCSKSQTEKKTILNWLPFVATAQLAKAGETKKAILLPYVNAAYHQEGEIS